MSYINCTKEFTMTCFVGDPPKNCELKMFCDASFAGDLTDSKSTTGVIMVLVGPNTFCPLSWICKKQGAVCHSSTEAEVISMDTGLRMEGIPLVDLWELVIDIFAPPAKPSELTHKKRMNKPTDPLDVHYVPPSI